MKGGGKGEGRSVFLLKCSEHSERVEADAICGQRQAISPIEWILAFQGSLGDFVNRSRWGQHNLT